MKIFRSKRSDQGGGDPLCRDVVMRLINLGMREFDAACRDIDSDEFARAKAERDAAFSAATPAERDRAWEALQRNGYV